MVLLLLKHICLTESKLLRFIYHCIAVLSSSSKDYRQEKRNVWVYSGKAEMISLHTFSAEKRMLLNMDLPKGEQDLSALVKKKPAAAQEEAGVSTKTRVMAPMLIYDPPFSSSPMIHQFNFCFFPFVLHFVASHIMAFSAVFFLPCAADS
jgi:hypothetical protein